VPPASTPLRGRRLARSAVRRAGERVVALIIKATGWFAIIILAAIALFLLWNSVMAVSRIGLVPMLTGDAWYPTSTPPKFGMLPLIAGSLLVTAIAVTLSVPVGVAASVYVSEFAPKWLKDPMKSVIEFMAAVPSVVYGLLGLAFVVPAVAKGFSLPSGLSALAGGIVLSLMALPTIISISEDALHAVPDDLRQGSLALGNTRWQTMYKVVIPAASSGIFAAVMLGVGRAIGETMAVLMVTGNAAAIPTSVFDSVRTMTGTIAAEMGESVQGGMHFSVLFTIGLVLFVITFVVNLAADVVLERQRQRWRR
jgi:phosphate transport system permease protein